MTGAMYAAIAGLKTHMSKLNVVGNNIANVNTNGYKSQRTVFRDALYTMYSGGSDGTTTTGSKNPSQIGYGSQVSSIDLNMTTGNYSPGNTMDCMLYGDGFFLVGNKTTAASIDSTNPDSFKALKLTRVGDFRFGADGYLVDGKGNPVYGFMNTGVDKDGKPQISDQLVPIRLPKVEGKTIKFPVVKNADGNENIALKDAVGHEKADDPTSPEVELPFASLDSISIDTKSGRISGTVKDTDSVVTIGYLAVGNPTNPDGVTHEGESYYSCSDGAGDLKITMLGGVAEDLGIKYLNVIAGGANALAAKFPFTDLQSLVAGSSSFGNFDAAIFEKLGFQVTAVTPPETYEALDRGMIDATQMGLAPMVSMAWYEVAPYWALDDGMFLPCW